jgi:hypothetical protein
MEPELAMPEEIGGGGGRAAQAGVPAPAIGQRKCER